MRMRVRRVKQWFGWGCWFAKGLVEDKVEWG